jgi:hypothetical protein
VGTARRRPEGSRSLAVRGLMWGRSVVAIDSLELVRVVGIAARSGRVSASADVRRARRIARGRIRAARACEVTIVQPTASLAAAYAPLVLAR